jgi:hypothetical protein
MKVPVAFELGAGDTLDQLGPDIGPCRRPIPLHVRFGDLIRDALVAERRDQPIEKRRRIAIPNGGGDTEATILIANPIKEIGRAGKTTNAMDQSNRMVECGSLLARFLMGSMLVVERTLSTGCRPGDHGCHHSRALDADININGLATTDERKKLNPLSSSPLNCSATIQYMRQRFVVNSDNWKPDAQWFHHQQRKSYLALNRSAVGSLWLPKEQCGSRAPGKHDQARPCFFSFFIRCF